MAAVAVRAPVVAAALKPAPAPVKAVALAPAPAPAAKPVVVAPLAPHLTVTPPTVVPFVQTAPRSSPAGTLVRLAANPAGVSTANLPTSFQNLSPGQTGGSAPASLPGISTRYLPPNLQHLAPGAPPTSSILTQLVNAAQPGGPLDPSNGSGGYKSYSAQSPSWQSQNAAEQAANAAQNAQTSSGPVSAGGDDGSDDGSGDAAAPSSIGDELASLPWYVWLIVAGLFAVSRKRA